MQMLPDTNGAGVLIIEQQKDGTTEVTILMTDAEGNTVQATVYIDAIIMVGT